MDIKYTIYLAGPINGCTDAECKDWRNAVKSMLPQHRFLDPMSRDYRGKEAANVEEIVVNDKQDILNCDILFAYYTKPSVGTSMEILFAWENGIEVVLVNASGNENISPWLLYHANVHKTLEDAVRYIADKPTGS